MATKHLSKNSKNSHARLAALNPDQVSKKDYSSIETYVALTSTYGKSYLHS